MRIGWLLSCYGPLGGVRSVIETGNSLVRKGHDFTVIGNVAGSSSFCEDIIKNKIYAPTNIDIGSKYRLEKCKEFDLLFNQDPATMHYNEYIKRKHLSIHYCCGDGECYKQFEELDGIRTSCSNFLFQVSKDQDTENKHSHYYIGQGINFNEFKPINMEDSYFYAIRDNSKINIMCCGPRGGLRKSNKGTYDIIEASLLLDKDKYNFIYFDLTKQDFPDNFKLIETMNFQNNRKTLRDVYSICDIFIAPDYVSAWNCCAAEAMACNKPVICSYKGTDDFGKDEINCIKYHENKDSSPSELAQKIEMLANDKEKINFISNNGYNDIKEFTWDKVADRIINIGKELNL